MTNRLRLAIALPLWLTCSLPVFAEEPLRDPWKGFGLGSWISIEEHREVARDGETKPVTLLEKHEVIRTGPGNSIRISHEDGRTSQQMHVNGRLPEEMGLKKSGQTAVRFTIGQQEFDAVETTYVSDPDDRRLELLTKRFPDSLKQGGLKGAPGHVVELTMRETDGVDIPYSEVSLPGRDLALAPSVVYARITILEFDDQEQVRSRETREWAVKSLSEPVTVGDTKVVCTKVKYAASRERPGTDGEVETADGRGVLYLSNEVPGRLVKSEETLRKGENVSTRTKRVLAYKAFPVQDYLLKDLPDLSERPAIGLAHWKGLHLGAWRGSFTANVRAGGGVYAFGSLSRVVAIREDGSVIVESRSFDGEGKLEDPSYRIEAPASNEAGLHDGLVEVESGRGNRSIGGEERAVVWEIVKSAEKEPAPGESIRPADVRRQVWRLQKPSERDATLPFEGAVQALDWSSIEDSVSVHRRCEYSRLVDEAWKCEINGKPLTAAVVLTYGTEGDEKEYQYESWTAEFFTSDIPSTEPLRVERSIQNNLVNYTVLFGWGEFETPAPQTPDEIFAGIRAVLPVIERGLAEIDSRMEDEAFRKGFIQTKDRLESRLMEKTKTTAESPADKK